MTGMVIKLGYNNMVMFSSKLQKHATSSSMEAEVDGMHHAMLELFWLNELLDETGIIDDVDKIYIYEDNQAALSFAKGSQSSQRTKHMRRRYKRVIHELDAHDNWSAKYVATDKMLADVMTKNLGRKRFLYLYDFLMGFKEIKSLVPVSVKNNTNE